MPYPNLENEDPTLLKIATKYDEIKELKLKTERKVMNFFWNHQKLIMTFTKRFSKVQIARRCFHNNSQFLKGSLSTLYLLLYHL